MAVDSTAVHGPARGDDMAGYWAGVAAADLGVAPSNLFFHFHPFWGRGELAQTDTQLNGSGTRSAQVRALRLSSGTTAAHFAKWHMGGFAVPVLPIEAGAAKKMWIAGEFSINTAVTTAGTEVGLALHDYSTGHLLNVGGRASSSAANFVAWGDTGGSLDTGLALDTNKHVHKFFRNGTTGLYRIYSPTTGAIQYAGSADIRASASCNLIALALTGDTTDRTADFSWIAMAVPRGG